MYSDENFDPRIIFYSEIWLQLQNENDEVVREVVNYMVSQNLNYQINGGTYPAVEFVIGLAKDKLKENESSEKYESENLNEMENLSDSENLTQKEKMQKVRDSWLNK
jgi:hypothetical protein